MALEMNTKYGNIDVSREVVAVIAGGAAVDCYGIVGMASQKHLKDGLTDLLGKENLARGVVIREENEEVHIDMYIIVSYGTKISEVAYNVQQKVKYQLEKMLGLKVNSANIFISGVRVTN
jgi:uncharacterized alkaline shock family protein YloU